MIHYRTKSIVSRRISRLFLQRVTKSERRYGGVDPDFLIMSVWIGVERRQLKPTQLGRSLMYLDMVQRHGKHAMTQRAGERSEVGLVSESVRDCQG